MKKILTAVTCLVFLALLVNGTAFAQEQTAGTGDKKLDAQLKQIKEQAKADPEGFLRRLSQKNNVPEEEIRKAKEEHGLDDGDTYMATTLSRISKRPVGAVAGEYKKNQGKGWGMTARGMGIKPGSPEFKALKADAKSHVGHMKTMAKAKKKQHEQEMKEEKAKGKKIKDEAEAAAKGKGKKK